MSPVQAEFMQNEIAFLDLPAELLHLIFRCVGSSNFRKDLTRLTVSKKWGEFAKCACYQDFYVTPKTLGRLLSARYKTALPMVTNSIEILDLHLKGFEDWNAILRGLNSAGTTNFISQSEREYAPIWMRELNQFLYQLVGVRQKARKFRDLRIKTIFDQDLMNPVFSGYNKYLFPSTLHCLLSGSILRNLNLDICGTYRAPFHTRGRGDGVHVCQTIATLFTTLRRLRLRTACICPLVLRPRPDAATDLPLRELLINLSLSEEPTKATVSDHTARCCPEDEEVYLESDLYGQELFLLRADLIEEAKVLVAQLAAPKVVRILWHQPMGHDLLAFDVLTGRKIKLNKGSEWDEEGKPVTEAASDLKRIGVSSKAARMGF